MLVGTGVSLAAGEAVTLVSSVKPELLPHSEDLLLHLKDLEYLHFAVLMGLPE